MKKRNGWKWALGFTIWFAISTVATLTSNMYDDYVRWPIAAALTVVLGVLTFFLRSKAKKEEEAESRRRFEAMEAERKQREEREAKVKEFQERYAHIRFPVAGVTFKNDDNVDRQKILLEISFNGKSETDVWLEEEDESLGEESGIRVMTDYGCVGYIRRSDKAEVRRFTGQTICTKYLDVEQFLNDEGEKIYRADVVFVLDRRSPKQQWYFDDLQKQ